MVEQVKTFQEQGDLAQRIIFPIKPASTSLGEWKRTHDYEVWTECRPKAESPLTLWEAHGNGVIKIPDNDYVMHIIRGGVPHHIERLFGYWRASDSDIVWFRIVQEEWVHYAMILGGQPDAYQKDAILWICPSCASRIAYEEITTGRRRIAQFWRREKDIVAAFNEDTRTCKQCGRVHPPAYRFRRLSLEGPPSPEEW